MDVKNEYNKLSNNLDDVNLFLYDGNIVSTQYLFRKIWEGTLVKGEIIPFVIQDTNFETAMNNIVKQIAEDVQNDVDNEWYDLPNLSIEMVEIDIDKENLHRESEYTFSFTRVQ